MGHDGEGRWLNTALFTAINCHCQDGVHVIGSSASDVLRETRTESFVDGHGTDHDFEPNRMITSRDGKFSLQSRE